MPPKIKKLVPFNFFQATPLILDKTKFSRNEALIVPLVSLWLPYTTEIELTFIRSLNHSKLIKMSVCWRIILLITTKLYCKISDYCSYDSCNAMFLHLLCFIVLHLHSRAETYFKRGGRDRKYET